MSNTIYSTISINSTISSTISSAITISSTVSSTISSVRRRCCCCFFVVDVAVDVIADAAVAGAGLDQKKVDGDEVAWFLLTSSNLSRSAWGFLDKKVKRNVHNEDYKSRLKK